MQANRARKKAKQVKLKDFPWHSGVEDEAARRAKTETRHNRRSSHANHWPDVLRRALALAQRTFLRYAPHWQEGRLVANMQ